MGSDKQTGESSTTPPAPQKRELPSGIEIYQGKKRSAIRIRFRYRGVECEESFKLEPNDRNLKFAERKRGQILNEIGLGTFDYAAHFPNSNRAQLFGAPPAKLRNTTVGERLCKFLAQFETAVVNRKRSIATLNGYRKIINGHLLPAFDNKRISELSPVALREFIQGIGGTAKTVRNVISPLRLILDEAVADELILANPLDKIDLARLIDITTKSSEYAVDPFDLVEVTAILSACDNQLRNLFQFAFYSGLRTSELIALEWGDIDWVHGLICVRRAIVCKTEKGTKTTAGMRDVMLNPSARAALEAQKAHTFLLKRRVFHNPRTGGPWETDAQIRKTGWTHILTRAGVRYRNPYQTRHTFACMALSRRESILWVAEQLGHKGIEVCMRNYGKKWVSASRVSSTYQPVSSWDDFATGSIPDRSIELRPLKDS